MRVTPPSCSLLDSDICPAPLLPADFTGRNHSLAVEVKTATPIALIGFKTFELRTRAHSRRVCWSQATFRLVILRTSARRKSTVARCVFTAATKREIGFFHSCFGGGVSSLVAKQHRHTHKHTLLLLHSNWVYYLKLPITVKYFFKMYFYCIQF